MTLDTNTRISQGCDVLLHFCIKLSDGSVAEDTKALGKPAKMRLGDGSLTPEFEACLLGLTSGDKASFTLAPEDAFGMPEPNNIKHMDRHLFVGELAAEEGRIIAFSGPNGQEIPGIITQVEGDSVTVDFNHPLAGHTIMFDVEILQVNQGES